jgi:hypothetical protein
MNNPFGSFGGGIRGGVGGGGLTDRNPVPPVKFKYLENPHPDQTITNEDMDRYEQLYGKLAAPPAKGFHLGDHYPPIVAYRKNNPKMNVIALLASDTVDNDGYLWIPKDKQYRGIGDLNHLARVLGEQADNSLDAVVFSGHCSVDLRTLVPTANVRFRKDIY